MARTRQNQHPANRVAVPIGVMGGRPPPSMVDVAVLLTSVVAALWAAAMLIPAGRIAYLYVFVYAEFYMGALTLVSLTVTVILGLVATDRMMLSARQRIALQTAHRTIGIIAVITLVVHLLTKLAMDRVTVIDLFVPFLAANQILYIGLGTTAAFLMMSVLWTGIIRARFAGRGKPWMWRSLHSVAYLAWPIALLHGLNAGRAPPSWVTISLIACVVFVLLLLAVRLSVSLGRPRTLTFVDSRTRADLQVATVFPGGNGQSMRRPEPVARSGPSYDDRYGMLPRHRSAEPRPERRAPELRRRDDSADGAVMARSRSVGTERYSGVPQNRFPRSADRDRGRRSSGLEDRRNEPTAPRPLHYVENVEPARGDRPVRSEYSKYGDGQDSGRRSRPRLASPTDPLGSRSRARFLTPRPPADFGPPAPPGPARHARRTG
jgi:hypothetical protein